jgi:O-antigen/teichoic acid export membrane protein
VSNTQKKYWLKSGLLTILEKGSVFIFGFGGFSLLTWYFVSHYGNNQGKVMLGIWVIFYTITSFIEVGRVGLLQNALIKYLTDAKGKAYSLINSASIALNGLITFIFILFLIGLAYPFGNLWDESGLGLTEMMIFYCITAVLMIPFHQFNFIQMANLDFRGAFWSNFTRQGLFFIYILLSVVLDWWVLTLVSLVIAQAAATLCGVIVNALFARPYLRFSNKVSRTQMRQLFDFGRYVFGTNISTMVYKSIDKMMLASLIGPAAASIYEWPIKISNLTEVPTFSIASVVFPKAASASENEGPKALKKLYEQSVGSILGLIAPFALFIILFTEFIIITLAGPEFEESIMILRLTIFYGAFIPFAVLFGTVLDAMGKPKINFYFTIGGSIINIFFNYFFITRFGIIGAAYGTLTSYAITFAAQQFILNKLLGVNAFRSFVYIPEFYKQGLGLARNFLSKSKVISETEI